MDVRSSWLVAAETLVKGVFTELPLTEEAVAVDVDASDLPLDACFAAFSARRFCFDAEGAMVDESKERREQALSCPHSLASIGWRSLFFRLTRAGSS